MRRLLVALACAALVTAGCGATIPTDPDGTLERVRGGVLRAGVSPNEPWTVVDDGEPAGLEVELVEDFAATLDAEVEWTVGGEEALVGDLDLGELDVVVGGLSEASPWTDKASLTYAYAASVRPDGSEHRHVMAVPAGENAFLVELEHFLLDRGAEL